ncbi:hypothetical protein BH688_00625 [Kushneria phosphatilytica]|nr:hypothetical protein BH688_00625 [Kushneria phosphatilytica]
MKAALECGAFYRRSLRMMPVIRAWWKTWLSVFAMLASDPSGSMVARYLSGQAEAGNVTT